MWDAKFLQLLIVAVILFAFAGCKEKAEAEEPTVNELTIDTTPIHEKPIPFPNRIYSLAIIEFNYTDCNETRSVEFIINDANELEIKYENCTPIEGARIAYWLMEDYNVGR